MVEEELEKHEFVVHPSARKVDTVPGEIPFAAMLRRADQLNDRKLKTGIAL